ncbi:chitobiase/beta-hexosaminidase C-terminal domain-containing protein [Clostridium saccharoperbutylacetonicum]|uniref:chitobiase/beta-hexosaminidase C-terminal domain-containing protein n=1 Tax=Clostridium saccharoperbutylacetonicum TaxID=36745 RepID=UPI0009856AC8|nr:chitobiase/beta-hexosaminidase C-terminal domain-containing protein [Clostridium saccharoperbutylacetonicum]
MSSKTSGAAIYYTTDGSIPTTSSTVYKSPITISKTTILKAIAIKSGELLC